MPFLIKKGRTEPRSPLPFTSSTVGAAAAAGAPAAAERVLAVVISLIAADAVSAVATEPAAITGTSAVHRIRFRRRRFGATRLHVAPTGVTARICTVFPCGAACFAKQDGIQQKHFPYVPFREISGVFPPSIHHMQTGRKMPRNRPFMRRERDLSPTQRARSGAYFSTKIYAILQRIFLSCGQKSIRKQYNRHKRGSNNAEREADMQVARKGVGDRADGGRARHAPDIAR